MRLEGIEIEKGRTLLLALVPTTEDEAETITMWRRYFSFNSRNKKCRIGQIVTVRIITGKAYEEMLQNEYELNDLCQRLKDIASRVKR